MLRAGKFPRRAQARRRQVQLVTKSASVFARVRARRKRPTLPVDTNDLGADIEFWLGEGDETDKLAFSTASLVFVPRNLVHMPIIYRNVKKPILLVIVSPDAGEMRKKVINSQVRGV